MQHKQVTFINIFMESVAYTYLVGWTQHDKWYYGVRYAKHCTPSDLWSTYFTSSSPVKFFRQKHGEPDVIEVRKVFNDKHQAILWEQKVLSRVGVLKESKWLNANVSHAPLPNSRKRTEEHKKKISEALKGRKRQNKRVISEETRKKISETLSGRSLSSEHRRALSEAKKNSIPWNKGKRGVGGGNPQTTVHVCPHCNKSGKGNAMFKWHFDNCKSNWT